MNTINQKDLKIGNSYRYNSSQTEIDSFTFTIFQINKDNVDIIINNSQYSKLKLEEFTNSNLIQIQLN